MSVEAPARIPYLPFSGLSRLTIFALAIIAITLFVCVAGSFLVTQDPYSFSADMNEPPSAAHLLGTDDQGQDVYSRLIVGTRLSLVYGAGAACVALLLGALASLLAMSLGKVAEAALFAVIDLIRALPGILFALTCIVAFEPGMASVILALGVSFAPHFAMMTRATYKKQMAQPYTSAAKVLGAGKMRIAIVHVLPNILGALITQFAIVLPRCIVSESVLSFLGLGASPETPTWGRMIASSTPYIEQAPFVALAPIIVLSLVTFALAITGNAMRQRFDVSRRSVTL